MHTDFQLGNLKRMAHLREVHIDGTKENMVLEFWKDSIHA
jgi:hypothetical protein